MQKKGLQYMVCLQCRHPFDNAQIKNSWLICSYCDARYPVVRGEIPVFFDKPVEVLATTYVLYENHIREEQKDIQRIKTLAQQHPLRASVLNEVCAARSENLAYIQAIQQNLTGFLSPNDLFPVIRHSSHSSYGVVMAYYLERDWGKEPVFEGEIQTRVSALLRESARYAPDNQSVLVLGAGMGRVAWELGQWYERVYAMDNNLIMPYSFYQVLEQDIIYYDIQLSNVVRSEDRVRQRTASRQGKGAEEAAFEMRQQNLTYFLGDVTRLPLPDHSQSAIASVYFTDVLPLKEYLSEVKRVLKPGGLFMHYGPLVYHFQDESDMLTADEVLEVFRENGFAIATNELFQAAPPPSISMSFTSFTNWLFTAVKETEVAQPVLSLTSRVQLATEIQYEQQGKLTENEESNTQVVLQLPSGERLKTSVAMLDLLRILDAEQTIAQALHSLSEQYDFPSDAHQAVLLETLQQLVEKKVLKKVSG